MSAIRKNMALLDLNSMTVPYKVKFHPSKAAGREEVGIVVTDDPAAIGAESIIPTPITHETMHRVAMLRPDIGNA